MSAIELVHFPKGTEFAVGFSENENCVALVFVNEQAKSGLVWRIDSKEEAASISDDLLACAARIAEATGELH